MGFNAGKLKVKDGVEVVARRFDTPEIKGMPPGIGVYFRLEKSGAPISPREWQIMFEDGFEAVIPGPIVERLFDIPADPPSKDGNQ